MINGLSDAQHPCQAMADARRFTSASGGGRTARGLSRGWQQRRAVAGAGVANFGVHFVAASPSRYSLSEDDLTPGRGDRGAQRRLGRAVTRTRQSGERRRCGLYRYLGEHGQEAETESALQRCALSSQRRADEARGKTDPLSCTVCPRTGATKSPTAWPRRAVMRFSSRRKNRLHIQKAILVT